MGMYLESVNLWIDEKGYHGMKYGMKKPDMAPDMCIRHKELPAEALRIMSWEDKSKVNKVLKGINER